VHLGQRGGPILEEHQRELARHGVERPVLERQ
jgi:hypothetical protein